MTENNKQFSADEIIIDVMKLIDKTFMDCKYYCKPYFNFGFFTLGICNNPKRIKNDLELTQCIGSDCKDLKVMWND